MQFPLVANTSPAISEISDEELIEIGTILMKWRGFNMSAYKDKCMKRRVALRLRSTDSSDVAAYCNLLRSNPQELELLQKSLTIHVSQFFRNPLMFEKLRKEILPAFFASRSDIEVPLRFWCLGCAGGEEPYSLAIILREYFPWEIREFPTTIVGTDIDAETLNAAQAAHYKEDRLKEVPDKLRERYFCQGEGVFQVTPEIRAMVTFSKADIGKVEEYIPSRLVLCRNTLIYFTRPEQEKILNGIADILPPDGILVLGKSENLVGSSRRRFAPVCPIERIYRRI